MKLSEEEGRKLEKRQIRDAVKTKWIIKTINEGMKGIRRKT